MKYELRISARGSGIITKLGDKNMVAEVRGQSPEENEALATKIVALLNDEAEKTEKEI